MSENFKKKLKVDTLGFLFQADTVAGPAKTSKPASQEKAAPKPRFLVVKNMDGGDFGSLNPIVISKAIYGQVGEVKAIRKIKDGILIETTSEKQSTRLSELKRLADANVTVTPHRTLNSSRGVIVCRDLLNCSDQEILEELTSQGVTDIKRIQSRRNGELKDSGSFLLTFDKPTLPGKIKVAFYALNVRAFIPSPMRCFRCQRFGHTTARCKDPQVCVCGKALHEGSPCKEPVVCVNCAGSHNAKSRNCPTYKKEVSIQELKIKENLSFFEARKRLEVATPKGVSYARAAATPSTTPPPTTAEIVKELVPQLVPVICDIVSRQITGVLDRLLKSSSASKADTRPSSASEAETRPSSAGDKVSDISDTLLTIAAPSTKTSATENKSDDKLPDSGETESETSEVSESPTKNANEPVQARKRKKGWVKGRPRKPRVLST